MGPAAPNPSTCGTEVDTSDKFMPEATHLEFHEGELNNSETGSLENQSPIDKKALRKLMYALSISHRALLISYFQVEDRFACCPDPWWPLCIGDD